ncbi:MAG TPA: protein kinase [Bryobacteraceae bacterium]|jgi:serine/threonine protein kinase|nr:protein kinase [Bryobacteraceae bacterium]
MNTQTLCVGCMENDSGLPECPTCGRPFDLPPRSPLQLKPRTMLHEQYLIGRALGDGGFGITYLSWDLGLESRLAIKEYMPNGVAGRSGGESRVIPYTEQTKQEFEWGLDRFLEEARVLKKFSNHPGIVSVDTVFKDNGTAYLVMEFLDGVTFEEFLARRGGKITFETAMRVVLPSMDALAAVHAEGILHRDISPDNIYLTRAGKVKLIDFGAARNALGQKSRNLSIILKEGYAPEEQYRASGIQGPWTDVYAMAATLYHAITGRIPQPALDRQAQDKLLWPSQLQVQIEPRVEAALMKALSIKAGDRFQSMEDFKAALTGGATSFAPAAMPVATPAVPMQAAAYAPPPPPPPAPPSQAQVPPSYQPPVPLATPTQAVPPSQAVPPPPSSSSTKWLWLMIPIAAILIGGAVLLTIFLPKLWHKESVIVAAPAPTVDTTPIPANPDSTTTPPANPDNATPPANPDDAKPADTAAKDTGTATATDSGTATATDSGAAAADAPPADPGPAYDTLTGQGVSYIAAGDTDNAVNVYLQAIKLVPKNPKAYAALGELYLYTIGNLPEAAKYYRAAVARGGAATFHVHHDRGGGNFTVASDGRLLVSNSSVAFVSAGGADSFRVSKGEVKEAKPNKVVGLFAHGQVSLMAFHVRLASGKNYNFAPGSNFTLAERDLILTLIGRG